MLAVVPSDFGSSKGRMEAGFELFWLSGRLPPPVADIVDRREQHFCRARGLIRPLRFCWDQRGVI